LSYDYAVIQDIDGSGPRAREKLSAISVEWCPPSEWNRCPRSLEYAKLRVRYELAKENVGAAIEQLNLAPWTHRQLRNKLAWEIGNRGQEIAGPGFRRIANQALASG
jgi:hypothetical protein